MDTQLKPKMKRAVKALLGMDLDTVHLLSRQNAINLETLLSYISVVKWIYPWGEMRDSTHEWAKEQLAYAKEHGEQALIEKIAKTQAEYGSWGAIDPKTILGGK